MEYWIKRGEAEYGPYSLAGLQNYLQSGNLLRDDLTRSEGMADWLPLWQVLGTVPVPEAPAPGMAVPSGQFNQEEQARLVDLPPNLPWWLVLILSFFTRGLFELIWSIVLGNWSRKLSGNNTGLVLVSLYGAAWASAIGLAFVAGMRGTTGVVALSGLVIIVGAILGLIGKFYIRSDMELYYNKVEPIGLTLSGVMVFFFGAIYLQYHVNSIASTRKLLGRV